MFYGRRHWLKRRTWGVVCDRRIWLLPPDFCRGHWGFGPEREKIIPLKRIAFDNDLKALGKLCGASAQVRVAFVMQRAVWAQRWESEEVIVAATFAQAKDFHDWRASDGRHHIAPDGEWGGAAQKGNMG